MGVNSSIIFLVDADLKARQATARVLNPAGYAVEEFSTARAFLARPRYFGAGCLIFETIMPDMSGFQLQEAAKANGYDLPAIIVTSVVDIPGVVKLMRGGASDVLTKPVVREQLLESVSRAIATHREILGLQSEMEKLRRRFLDLTDREREVCLLVGRGFLNKQIAAELGAADGTIKIHRSRMMRKLGVQSVAELVRMLDRIHADRVGAA